MVLSTEVAGVTPGHVLISAAVRPIVDVLGGVTPEQFTAATPCDGFDVRGLLGHLLYWGPSLAGAARKESVPPPPEPDPAPRTAAVVAQLRDTAAAWGEPAAWDGRTRMAGPDEHPAELIGGMVLAELVVHGWDLAVATGQRPEWPADVLEFTHRCVAETAEWGRQMGAYGPLVEVPETAGVLDRLLALTGRDPARTPR